MASTSNAVVSLCGLNDDGLVRKLREALTGVDASLFVDSFATYLQYGDDDTAHVIDLDAVWEWMGFSRKDHAVRLLDRKFDEGKGLQD